MSVRRWLALLPPLALAPFLLAADPPAPADKILKRFVEELVPLTPGKGKFPASYQMGSSGKAPASEKPAVKITFSRPFAVARYEVTQELYKVVAGKEPSKWKGPRNSVEMVSWDEANEFCTKVTKMLRDGKLIKADELVRLPSEAEWEYACRAGTTTAYYFGNDATELGAYAWYAKNSKGEDPPVGRKKPNAWGVYDMAGYVSEWCADSWSPDHTGASPDGKPRVKAGEKDRVIRGGSFADPADACRSAARDRKAADFRSDRLGFRCVLEKVSNKE